MIGMPTPKFDPSANLSATWTGANGLLGLDDAGVVGAPLVTALVLPLAPVTNTVFGEPLPPPELQADRTSAAPTSSANALHRRGRGTEFGFVTPPR